MTLGKTQKLVVDSFKKQGAILKDEGGDTVLLPNKETEGVNVGDELDVFIYRDSEDRLTATRQKPKLELGEFAPLKVVAVNDIGAFLDWGLDKDLFLPYAEQLTKVIPNRTYFVQLYVDKSDRLAATMRVYENLSTESPLRKGDWTEGYVYSINPELGAFVAVENKYSGMIRKTDINDSVKHGEYIKVRVEKVRPDGRLTLSPIRKSYKEIVPDSIKIQNKLRENGGFLPFNDKSSPEAIRAEFDISKGAFKKALGHLLKSGMITQTPEGIKSTEKDEK